MKRILTAVAVLVTACATVFAQGAGYQVKGVIVDAIGPVIGASVIEQGTSNGTSTGLDGDYLLNVSSADAIIEISCIGYATQTFPASAVPAVITLTEDTEFLDDVVVIGYGTVKKNDLTGSVTSLKPDSKNKGVVVSPQDMLSGKVAGVAVTNSGGAPGGGSNIRIRGGSSLNASNDPLIVIDGIAMDPNGVKGLSNPLSIVNPADIESFNVLKDASATAIYGSRGSNGVIIITTKKGRENQAPQVTYSGSASVSFRVKGEDVLNGDEYRALIRSVHAPDSPAVAALGTANTDWQSEIFRPALGTDQNVTLTGAYKNLPYRASIGYTGEQGILRTSDFNRFTGSVNLNPTFFDNHLTVNLNGRAMYALTSYADQGAIGSAVRMDPTQPVYDYTSPDAANFGHYFEWKVDGSSLGDPTWPNTINRNAPANPVAQLALKSDKARSASLIGSVEMDYKVHGLEDLHLHLTMGGDYSKGTQHTAASPQAPQNIYYGYTGDDTIVKRNASLTAYAQYIKDLKAHHFDVMAGYEWQHFWRHQNSDGWGVYPSTSPQAGQKTDHVPYEYLTENYIVSFFGRANYSLLSRYLFTATVRYDGSSRFKNHWALFPSFAFAWKIKEESFLRDVNAVSDLKLRLGWGQTGQQEGIGDYNYAAVYNVNNGTKTFYPVTGDGTLYRPQAYDPTLHWETTTTSNIGIDFGFLNSRLVGSVDLYYRLTTDLINKSDVPAGTNFRNQVRTNIGSLSNKGIELSLEGRIIDTQDWFWTVSGNLTYNINRIESLVGGAAGYYIPTGSISSGTSNTIQAFTVGQPAQTFLVYQQIYDKDGRPIEGAVVDRTGEGQINESDMYYYKSPFAPWTAGLSSRLEYKHFDLGISMRANIGNYVFNDREAGQANVSPNELWALSTYLGNRPRAALENNWQTYDLHGILSDYHVKNASFLKVDNITLGYSFEDVLSGYYVHSTDGRFEKTKGLTGRVYVTANNVWCLTKYNGIDPEVFGGIDNNIYPRPFSLLLGVTLNF